MMPYKDPEKQRAAVRENKRRWLAANPDKPREHWEKWRKANPEKARESNRKAYIKWRDANPEKDRERLESFLTRKSTGLRTDDNEVAESVPHTAPNAATSR